MFMIAIPDSQLMSNKLADNKSDQQIKKSAFNHKILCNFSFQFLNFLNEFKWS